MDESRDYWMSMDEFKRKFGIPKDVKIRMISCINDREVVKILTFTRKVT